MDITIILLLDSRITIILLLFKMIIVYTIFNSEFNMEIN